MNALLTEAQRDELLANGREAMTNPDFDPRPVVKLFMPDGAGTWLLAWLTPDDEQIAIGLCDLGMGFPEVGPVDLQELMELRGRLGLRVERDQFFVADKSLSVYESLAFAAGRITA